VQVVFRGTRVGAVTNYATVVTLDGLKAQAPASTQITAPQLAVAMTGPATGVIGMPITYEITVSNPGTGPATNVMLTDAFDRGLEHATHASAVDLPVGTVAARDSKHVTLTLTPRQTGRLVNRVKATADAGLTANAEHAVDVKEAKLSVSERGPGARYVNRPAVWDLTVTNPGEVPVTNVVLRDQLPAELAFVSATDGGTAGRGTVVWNLGTLQPREQRVVHLTTKCLQITPRAVTQVVATAEPGVQAQAEAPLEIRGLPAFRLEVKDTEDPVEIGGRTTYTIDVLNQGSLPGSQVEILAVVPPELRIISANGPTRPQVNGQRITWPPVDGVQPQQMLHYTVEAEGVKAGDARFHAELRSATLSDPVVEEESTAVVGALPPGPAAPARLTSPAATQTGPAPAVGTPGAPSVRLAPVPAGPAGPAAVAPSAVVGVGAPRAVVP
jgi:uncharacterized repeat protein (TIGR01451 family)